MSERPGNIQHTLEFPDRLSFVIKTVHDLCDGHVRTHQRFLKLPACFHSSGHRLKFRLCTSELDIRWFSDEEASDRSGHDSFEDVR